MKLNPTGAFLTNPGFKMFALHSAPVAREVAGISRLRFQQIGYRIAQEGSDTERQQILLYFFENEHHEQQVVLIIFATL